MRASSIALLLVVLSCAGCLRDELPVPAHHGTAVEGEACLGTLYEDQVWYDLGTQSIVRTNSKMDWDLAFESATDGWHVRLNPARFMRANPCGQSDIAQPTDTNGYAAQWRIDRPSGAMDSTAIGDWRSTSEVFVLDMGYAPNGLPIAPRKVRFISMNDTSYTFESTHLNGTGHQVWTVRKDPLRRYVHFSLLNGQQVDIAPPDGEYDIVFTQFTTQFYDPYIAYLVTGVINGFSGASVAHWSTDDLHAVTLADTLVHPFSSAEDAIGYDWKEYDFGTSMYTVDPTQVFIVRTAEGHFYRLNFVDFYNDQGERGCPQFEVLAL